MRDMGFDNDSLDALGVPATMLKAVGASHHAHGQMRGATERALPPEPVPLSERAGVSPPLVARRRWKGGRPETRPPGMAVS